MGSISLNQIYKQLLNCTTAEKEESEMNMNTITQELNKKIANMSKDDFDNFIERLRKVWYKHHKSEK